ncbi:bifunctional sugar-1-phosphate nucleotidylyltransferase/acetyltransferase [Methanolobus sp. WCC1]|jgi:bifunctional UDP-N-acetylglucosamine pyrophosphorylase/glucosamine-1-phosphate N-acetyltransferase|uniref:bifunctional sugar-1-phosphate nucleotidylyltransferase/acetyltransferase n=1 Tax=unclassified Methanolobus TaxID=2629569 RepID=UPI00258952BF|nr:bifunctional sugar-1-phosphate nucleotidylyltransferase/acetyltransferase [Methanolobus sp.]MDK2830662.1 UDP-N-acetylglucosamine diphosphorylase / glucose-phosphate thymidylyltransferase [Methanolobus sp.]
MKVVILAAGEGTRMRPLTASKPKVMLPIANKPMMEHTINAAIEAGVKEFLIVTGYREDAIKDYFKDGSHLGISVEYVRQEEQLGTANAIGCAKVFVNGHFIVLNGDMLVSTEHIAHLVSRTEDAIISVKKVENPSQFGVIETDEDKVTRIIEKPKNPPTNLANAGIYLFHEAIFDYIDKTGKSSRGEYEITDSLQMMIDDGLNVGYEVLETEWIDIGRPWDILDANKVLLENIDNTCEGTVEPYATLHGNVKVGKNTIIRNGAYIMGPVIIGDDCDIGPNCFIRASTAIGNDVRIGNAVEIKNTVIMDGTNVGHLSYVGDSVIGTNCNFGAGTKVANLRHDNKNVKSVVKGEVVDTGRRKLGVIMGDDVHTGINSSINIGTVMEAGSSTMPGEVLMYRRKTN